MSDNGNWYCAKCGSSTPGFHYHQCQEIRKILDNSAEVERLRAELASKDAEIAAMKRVMRQVRESIIRAIWLYDELAMSPLEAVAKHGPDYTPPLESDVLAVREDLEDSRALCERLFGK